MHLTTTLFNILLLSSPISASICRNLTNTYFSTESERQYSSRDKFILDRIECPRNDTQGAPKCPVSRTVHNITATRYINMTVSPEDEDAIFELARVRYWSRNLANNESLWDKAWDDKSRSVDLRSREWVESVFEAPPGYNYSVYFVPFTRGAFGTLGGCDNETLNGMGVHLRVPFLENNTVPESQTVVAGNVIGMGANLLEEINPNGGSGSAGNGSGGKSSAVAIRYNSVSLPAAVTLMVFALFL